MIQFKSYGKVPNRLYDARVVCLTTRNTLYGIHKIKGVEKQSKTHLIGFVESTHARMFQDYLIRMQDSGRGIERCSIHENVIIPVTVAQVSKLPLQVLEYRLAGAMKLCSLNFFNMHIVFDVTHGDLDQMTFHHYDYESIDYPNRDYINIQLESLLRS